jgi:hypothetical protein
VEFRHLPRTTRGHNDPAGCAFEIVCAELSIDPTPELASQREEKIIRTHGPRRLGTNTSSDHHVIARISPEMFGRETCPLSSLSPSVKPVSLPVEIRVFR